MSIDDDRQISPFVSDRLPEFVRIDHPTFVAFIEAYYEWLGLRRDSGLIISPLEMHDIPDVDTSLEQFLSYFKSQYLFNFPESLAVSKQTGRPVDARQLIKNIKQFYLAKGTEKSYEFLFRIFYDTNVEFYYPKTDILRLSSGRWTQNNYLRISNTLGDQIYRAPGSLLVQRNGDGQILATAKVIDVNVMQIDNFDVAELLITGRNGTFQVGDLGVEFDDGDGVLKETRVYSVVSTVDITNGGTNYQVGERINFVSTTGDGGQRGRATIVEVDAVGGIRKINIDDYGINYTNPPSIVIETGRGEGFVGVVTVGSLCQSFGFYMDNDGRLSTNKVLQDNHYYQNWSYVLKAEVVIDTYRELIRRLVHPVGMGMFGSVLIKRCSRANLDNASSLMSFRIPYIGNYTPYTFQTFDDLSLWFQESITGGMTASGYSANAHDDLLKGVGNATALVGNPISNNIPFKEVESGWLTTPGFPNADPFWIIYPHANKQVDRGYHYALVWRNQIVDFLSWSEWIYNQTGKTNLAEFGRVSSRLSRAKYDEFERSNLEGGVAGAVGGNCECTPFECEQYQSGTPPACSGTIRNIPDQGQGGGDCCCCDEPPEDEGGEPSLGFQRCVCVGGQFVSTGLGSICTCPHGFKRVKASGACGWLCIPDDGGGGGGGGGCDEGCPECTQCTCWAPGQCYCAPNCSPDNLGPCPCTYCHWECPDSCCPDGSCPPCLTCEDEEYRNDPANCCECFGLGAPCCSKPPPCDPNDPTSNCCYEDPCTQLCASFCSNFPSHPYCVNRCTFFPCCPGCTAECNPECPQFDPCLTSCPGFDYCVTGVSGWSSAVNESRATRCPQYGPCYDGPLPYGYEPCFDKCTATGCSGYAPCHADCPASQDPCGVTCPDECLCNGKCNQSCPNFDWCVCDPTGPTCCELQPCQLGCNPDFCDPSYANGQCFNPCDPSCTPDFCNPANAGFGCYLPCHPDCNPNNCNPLCPGFDRCNQDCPNWDRDFCCQGCNCGDGGDVGDPIYRDIDGAVRRWEEDNGVFNPNDNLCNNEISRCIVGPHSYSQTDNIGALVKYNENSEFRKITMRAFFNMPMGEAFDCREESIVNVAVPKFVVVSPKPGATFIERENSNRPLLIQFKVTNQENIAYYNIVQANVYIDNRLRSTVSINTRELTIAGIEDGRRTLKLEMIDIDGRFVAGTQEIVIFGYEFVPSNRLAPAFRRSSPTTDTSTSGFSSFGSGLADDNDPFGSSGTLASTLPPEITTQEEALWWGILPPNQAVNNPELRQLLINRSLSGADINCCDDFVEEFGSSPPIPPGSLEDGRGLPWSPTNPCGHLGSFYNCSYSYSYEIGYENSPASWTGGNEGGNYYGGRGFNPEGSDPDYPPPPNWFDPEYGPPCQGNYVVGGDTITRSTSITYCYDVLEYVPSGIVRGIPIDTFRKRKVCVETTIHCNFTINHYYGAGCGCPGGCSCDSPECKGHWNCP